MKAQTVSVFPPSLGDSCPRARCGLKMSTSRVEDFELVQCGCGYSCKQISGELKMQYHANLFERTAQRRGDAA